MEKLYYLFDFSSVRLKLVQPQPVIGTGLFRSVCIPKKACCSVAFSKTDTYRICSNV